MGRSKGGPGAYSVASEGIRESDIDSCGAPLGKLTRLMDEFDLCRESVEQPDPRGARELKAGESESDGRRRSPQQGPNARENALHLRSSQVCVRQRPRHSLCFVYRSDHSKPLTEEGIKEKATYGPV
jgi:hypothetical protein